MPSRLARFFTREQRSAIPGAGTIPAAPVLSGTYITPQTALALASVYAAINVISRDVASLPRAVYKKLPGGGLEPEASHPLTEVLTVAADEETDSFRYFQTTMGHTLGWGNGLSEIVRNRRGEVTALHLLHPAKTLPKRTAAGALYYELDNKEKLAPEDTLHFAGLGFDGVKGYTPITVCRQTIGLSMGVEQFGASFFGNGAIPKGLLKYPKRLSEAALNRLRGFFNQVHQGSQSAHQVAVLEEGMDWVNTQISPDDGQFLATREFQVKEIARLYGLPPHKIGDYSESHLANVEEANLDYLNMTLFGWVSMLSAQLNWKLLTPAERKTHVIAFDMTALMRGNTAARQEYYRSMRNMGVLSVDEIRLKEGLNPIGPARGGDTYVVQGQYIPLEQVGKEPPAPAAPKPPAAAAPQADEEADPEQRYNPYHDPKTGKFTSKGGGAGGAPKIVPSKKQPPGGSGGTSGKSKAAPAPATKAAAANAKDFGNKPAPEMKAHFKEMSSGWKKGLSEDERFAVRTYTGQSYDSLNKQLRAGGKPTGIMKDLDSAINRSSLKEDTVVYRGVSDLGKLGLSEKNMLGATIRDKAYSSTSLDRKVAEKYAAGGAVLRITAKAGTKGASMSGISRYDKESEVLFARNSGFKITGHERDHKGRLVIHAELVQ